jgi:hypothetical protein
MMLHVEGFDFSKMKPAIHNRSSYCIAIAFEFWSVTNSGKMAAQ